MIKGKCKRIVLFSLFLVGYVDSSAGEASSSSPVSTVSLMISSILPCLKAQIGVENIFKNKQESMSMQTVKLLLPFMSDTYRENLLTIGAGINSDNLTKLLSFKVKNDGPALCISEKLGHEKIKSRLIIKRISFLNQSLDDIIYNIIDSHKHKEVFLEHPKLKHAYLASIFRDQDWVSILFRDKNPTVETQTELLMKKYKREKLKKSNVKSFLNMSTAEAQSFLNSYNFDNFCEKQNILIAPLVGFYGALDCIAGQIVKIEREDEEVGRTTFVHGRNWEWNYVNDISNMIRALCDNKDVISDTISMRQRDIDCDIDRLRRARKNLVANGVVGGHLVSSTNDDAKDEGNGERSETTFLNYTGLSHLNCYGECAMRYVLENHSATGGASGRDVANQLIAKHKLQDYQEKFDALYQLHKQANDRGEMLTVSIANDKLEDIVWAAHAGGYKFSDTNILEVIAECKRKIQDQNTSYVQSYSDRFKRDCPIFCAGALSIPGEGEDVVKIRSHHLADQEKYNLYKQQRQHLFEELKDQKKQKKRMI